MQLPYRHKAYILPSKLSGYLLSPNHAVGQTKSKFFHRLGFNETNVGQLEQGLLAIAQSRAVKEVTSSTGGARYTIVGSLDTPLGHAVKIETVWIIEQTQEDRPRFVTAWPTD
jgi:hypothetical protein